MKNSVLLLVLALAAGVAYVIWVQYSAKEEAELELGLDAARVVNATFNKAAELKVAELKGHVTATASYDGRLFNAKQTSKIPFSVDYFVDVGRLDKWSYRWESDTKTLFVDIPDVKIDDPNLTEAAAVIKQEGIIVTREAGLEMAKKISERANLRVVTDAKKPEYIDEARESAREAVGRLARAPLREAELGDVRVAVRFPSERNGNAAPLSEHWDVSRRPEDVLKELREKGSQ